MKAPKFPSYDEAVNRKKKKAQNLLRKEIKRNEIKVSDLLVTEKRM